MRGGAPPATTTYRGVYKNIEHVCDTNPDVVAAHFELRFPATNAEILASFRAHLRAVPRAAPSPANPQPKVVCVLDSIVSNPGALMPWREMVQICREEGVYSVVDAAHSIGQEVGINLEEAQPDFWFSVRPAFPTCDGWAHSPSCLELS